MRTTRVKLRHLRYFLALTAAGEVLARGVPALPRRCGVRAPRDDGGWLTDMADKGWTASGYFGSMSEEYDSLIHRAAPRYDTMTEARRTLRHVGTADHLHVSLAPPGDRWR